MTLRIHEIFILVRDFKCDYPSACNVMKILLTHKGLASTTFFRSTHLFISRGKNSFVDEVAH